MYIFKRSPDFKPLESIFPEQEIRLRKARKYSIIARHMRIILGSQSPRRKEILSYFSLPFEQVPSCFDESKVIFSGDPAQYALELSQKKNDELFAQFPDSLIITADTVVYFNAEIYNKPKDLKEAFQMMKKLSGNWHFVYTAISLRKENTQLSEVEETKIRLHPMTSDQIHLYHSHCFPLDKAAGYAIQNSGSIIVDRIDGCYYNVMGLPINTLRTLLSQLGIDLWRCLNSF